jgi:hypothetical protein
MAENSLRGWFGRGDIFATRSRLLKRTVLWLAILVIVLLAGVAYGAIRRERWYRNAPEGRRQALLEQLQPVALANCELKRFGEPNDGGYLMCANLLTDVQTAYSYGISGYDGWGCDVSRQLKVKVHEYDCFNVQEPVCEGGALVFHPECVAGNRSKDSDGRLFDTPESQMARNDDAKRHLVVKMDVEGAEWETFLSMSDSTLDQIDQLAVEFHGANGAQFKDAIEKLKRKFYIANLHFNNYSCARSVWPFPAWAYEVLFVSKRIGVVDRSKPAAFSPLNAPNKTDAYDCQSITWVPLLRTLTH